MAFGSGMDLDSAAPDPVWPQVDCQPLGSSEGPEDCAGSHASNFSTESITPLEPPGYDVELPAEAAALAAQGVVPPQRVLESLARRNYGGARRIIYNFVPAWFGATMGTGIASIILNKLPYNADWLYWLSVIAFALNVLLFTTFSFITLLRYALYPDLWPLMIRNSGHCLTLSCFTVGFATIVDMMVLVCLPAWGRWMVPWIWTFWWIEAAMSLGVCYWLPYTIIANHKHAVGSVTCVWLLPCISAIVAAATGANVASVLEPQHALWTIVVSYVLWGTAVPLAFIILALYFHRLATNDLPPRDAAVSAFLPLGPLAQGGHGIAHLGKVALTVFPATHQLPAADGAAGPILYVLGWFTAVVMWAFACLWLLYAVANLWRLRRAGGLPFNLGWWAFTFPTGVLTLSTLQIGEEMPSRFFGVLGTVFACCNILLWLMCLGLTAWKGANGELFKSPGRSKVNIEEGTKEAERDQTKSQ